MLTPDPNQSQSGSVTKTPESRPRGRPSGVKNQSRIGWIVPPDLVAPLREWYEAKKEPGDARKFPEYLAAAAADVLLPWAKERAAEYEQLVKDKMIETETKALRGLDTVDLERVLSGAGITLNEDQIELLRLNAMLETPEPEPEPELKPDQELKPDPESDSNIETDPKENQEGADSKKKSKKK